jgi:hypothetical protein
MKPVRALLADLVERRLWPVAVALVVALVAVPVVLGRGGDAPIAPVAAVPADSPAATAHPAVSVAPTTSKQRDRAGSTRNPFKQLHVPTAAATIGAGTTTSSAGGASNGGDTTTTGGGTTSTGGGTGAKSATPLPGYVVSLRFGRTDTPLRTLSDIARLSPLPSAQDPFFVYLGVLQDRQTVVFLISSDVKATGDGTCRPSASTCETIEVKKGDTEFFDLVSGDQTLQYQLEVSEVQPEGTASSARVARTARAALARHSEAGGEILRDAHVHGDASFAGASAYRWLPASGLLVRLPRKVLAQVSAQHDHAGSRPAPQLPGEPVWHFAAPR